jgi:hypothetical protein
VPVLQYYADQADRAYGRITTRRYSALGEASAAADALVPPAEVVDIRTDAGVSIPAAYRDLFERDPDTTRVVRHSWLTDTWASFRQVPVSAHGAQAYTGSVVGRRGRVTSSADTSGNHRTWWLRQGTRWPDSEILSLWWGPDQFTPNGAPVLNRPQMGHVHGAYVGDDGRLRGAAVTLNIFGANPTAEILNMNLWEADGTTLWLGAGGAGGSADAAGRSARVVWANRFTFGSVFLDIAVHPHWAADTIVANSVGDLTGMAVTGLNGVDYTVQGGVQHGGVIRLNASGADVTDAVAGGVWTPDYPWRVFPYWVRSRYVPPVLSVKQWAYGRQEPDWGGPHTWVVSLATDADTTEVPYRPGLSGVVTSHAHSGSWMEWGDVLFGRAGALAA